MGFALQQGSGVELAGAEANVRLHVSELRSQQVSDQLNGHVLPSDLFTHTQRPENTNDEDVRGTYVVFKTSRYC